MIGYSVTCAEGEGWTQAGSQIQVRTNESRTAVLAVEVTNKGQLVVRICKSGTGAGLGA